MQRLFVEVPGDCPATCPGCPSEDGPGAPRLAHVLSEAARCGFDWAGLAGRDVLRQPAGPELLSAALDAGLAVRAYSGLGSARCDVSRYRSAAPAFPGRLDVTLVCWGDTGDHDTACSRPGALDAAVGRLEAWRAAGARVAAKLFLRRGLGGSVPTLRARLERRGIPLLVSAWWSRLGGSGRAFPAAGPDEAGPHVPCPRPVDRGPADAPCQAGRRRAFVDRHLRLRPCHVSSHVAADLSDTPLREAWEDDRRWGAWRSGTLSDLPSCLECDVQRFCHVCPAPVFDGRGTSACSDPALAWARHGASRADGRAAAGD